jgi:hypothetical protein
MVKRFLASGRTGFYLAVTRAGEVGADDEIKVIGRDSNGVPVSEITRLYIAKRYADDDVNSVRRALRVAALPESWKEYFRDRLEKVGIEAGQSEVKGLDAGLNSFVGGVPPAAEAGPDPAFDAALKRRSTQALLNPRARAFPAALPPLRCSTLLTSNPGCALGCNLAPLRGCLELEVASGGGSTGDAFGFARRKQAYHSSQVFPRGLVQGGIGADQVADHVPGGQVERALGWRSHGQGDGTLWAETDALRRRFLPRPYSDGLGKHIYRDGFVAYFDLPIAAQTKQVFQGSLPGGRKKILSRSLFRRKYAEGFPESGHGFSRISPI